jgi:hypothetical protein
MVGFHPNDRSHPLIQKSKAEVLPPRNAMALDTLAGVRGMSALSTCVERKDRSDEMTSSFMR